MYELKPCPFCGSKKVGFFAYNEGGVCVKCFDCYCQTSVRVDGFIANAAKESAVDRVYKEWNRRAECTKNC